MNSARRTTSAASAAVVLATACGLLTATTAPASAATTCASPVYKRQFFANTTFSGTPKKTDCDSLVEEKWGNGAPASGLPANNFGVRWSVTRDFGSGGPFALVASSQDGIRVYLDGVREINLWKNVSSTVQKTANVTIPSGKHTLRVDFANWTGAADVNFTYLPRVSATLDTVKPLTPTGAAATYDTATGKAKLTWAKNVEMDLAGYRVYRRLKGTAFGSTPLKTTTSTSYTDAALPVTGDTYYYEVRAYDRVGNESAGTADKPVVTVDRTAPAVPEAELLDSSEANGLRIGWSAVAGAVSYRVYRAGTEDGTYTRLATTDQVSYRDATAVESIRYYYRVTAVDAAGNESARSATVSAWRWDDTPPPAVTGLTATPTEYGFALSWDANSAEDLKYYNLYRGELHDDEGEQICLVRLVEDYLPADTTTYEFTTLPDGEEGCFFVDAVDDFGNSSWKWTGTGNPVNTTELDMTPSTATPEGSPLELTATGAEDDEGNHLDWNWSLDAQETVGYRVYRWSPATETYEKIADVGAGATDATDATEYYDTGARRGTTSFYWVTTVAADGTESLPAGDWAATAPAE